MATNFPTSLDAYVDPNGGGTLASATPSSEAHHTMHANAYDAIAALEAKVGVNGSLVTTSLDYKIANIAAGDNGAEKTQGFSSWAFDTNLCSSAAKTQVSGTLYVMKMYTPLALSVTSSYLICSNAASSPTGAFSALYSSAGALLATSANASAQFTGTGMKNFTFGATAIPVGVFYVAYWQVATAAASVLQSISSATVATGECNVNTSGATLRAATADTGLVATAPATVGAKTALTAPIWMAVS